MPNLHDLERRIRSVNSTKQITRTMEMVAAAKIRRSTERVDEATPYAKAMGQMLARIAARSADTSHPLLTTHAEIKNALYVAVVSDRGLAGGFNTNVLRAIEHMVRDDRANGIDARVIACGKKAISYFEFRNVELELVFKDNSADPPFEQAVEISRYLESKYTAGEIDKVVLVYNHAVNAAEQLLRVGTVLPIDKMGLIPDEEFRDVDRPISKEVQPGEVSADILTEPNASAVLGSLLPAYVTSMVYYALIDSAAAEQGARRTAMQSATDNANEMVENLTRYYNRVRQGAITTELNEIVSGAAALEE